MDFCFIWISVLGRIRFNRGLSEIIILGHGGRMANEDPL